MQETQRESCTSTLIALLNILLSVNLRNLRYFIDSTRRGSIEGTVLIEREKAERLCDADELRDLIRECGGSPV